MRHEDFTERSPGTLVPTLYGAKAFLPNPLPPKIDYAKIALSLGAALGSLGELKGACRRVQNPYIFIKPLQRLEAQTSSAMEGTHTTADKLALAEAGVQDKDDNQTKEVSNYIIALENAVKTLDDEPITHRTLKNAHLNLLRNVGRGRGEDKLPGRFKRDQNMIGGRTLDTARFIPPPPAQTLDCISDLERFINSERATELALIDVALAHYQFETIHPFADGNGRVGRMLITLMAMSKGLLDIPALFLSPALESKKDEYIERMYRVSAFGEWEEWLNFFFSAVSRASAKTVQTIDLTIALQEDYKLKAQKISSSVNLLGVIDMIFESPVVRPKEIVRRLSITDAAARGLLSKLVELDILYEYKGVYPKAWVAIELIELSSPDPY